MSADEPIPDWQLERFVLGELAEGEMRAVREALARDPRIGERIAGIQRSDAEILKQQPPAAFAASLGRRLATEPSARTRSPRRAPIWALAACAVFVAAVAVHFAPSSPIDAKPDVTRVKGGVAPRLMLYRQAASAAAEPLQPGSVARAADVVQIVYQVGAERYGAIVSVDGRGNVTSHLPKTGGRAAALAPGSPVPLPEAYELDDAPAFERFYLVTAREPFAVEAVVAAARRQASAAGPESAASRLELPANFDQLSFVLRKEDAR